jgi:hypothetical protein
MARESRDLAVIFASSENVVSAGGLGFGKRAYRTMRMFAQS